MFPSGSEPQAVSMATTSQAAWSLIVQTYSRTDEGRKTAALPVPPLPRSLQVGVHPRATGALLIYDPRCSRTRFRFARNPLFCLGSIIPIIGEKIFIQPNVRIWTRRVNLVPPLDGSSW